MSALAGVLAVLAPGVSQLWGVGGELWDPMGRLPDYSYAGYHAGEDPALPPPIVANVKLHYGAVGDGVADDTAAFRTALASMPPGTLFVPRGIYKLSDTLHIDRDGIVLMGAGSGPMGTRLEFTRSLQQISGEEHPWDWGLGGLIKIGVGPIGSGGWMSQGSHLTNVIASSPRGIKRLGVASTSGISAGDFVVLSMTDISDRSLGWRVHNDLAAPGTCEFQPTPIQWPVEVAQVLPSRVILDQPLRIDVETRWSPKLRRWAPVRESGLIGFSVRFPPHPYAGHLNEPGYNGICFEGALDCWIENVVIENADNGLSFGGYTKRCQAIDVHLKAGTDGHHGVSFTQSSSDCLLQDFTVEPLFIHSVTLDHQANGNVIRDGWGTDMYLDHHRDGPYENLFSNLHVGRGTSPWASGGSGCAGPHAGARNTYWNVHAGGWTQAPVPVWVGIQTNLIPAAQNNTTPDGPWTEVVPDLTPVDLYSSQLHRRLR